MKAHHVYDPKFMNTSAFAKRRGFALVITLALMVLLLILAVGLLSLSSISLRGSAHNNAQSEARSNARLALMVAMGELQKQMGPDQRISAAAENFSDVAGSNPHWTAALDSWIAGPIDHSTVNPNYPSPASHHQTLALGPNDPQGRPRGLPADNEMRPDYSDHKRKYFRRWLLSLNPGEAADPLAASNMTLNGKLYPEQTDDAAVLIGEGSLGSGTAATDIVSARLISVSSYQNKPLGRYAWFVSDENMKGKIVADTYEMEPKLSDAERVFRLQAAGSAGNRVIPGLEDYSNENDLAVLPSLATVDLVPLNTPRANADPRPSQKNFNDITTHSLSLCADPREGGMKRDLSTLLERKIDPAEVYVLEEIPRGATESFKEARGLQADGDKFMLFRLYEPGETNPANSLPLVDQASTPIQDLAAYYQMYDADRSPRTRGVEYSSHLISRGIQVRQPDWGTAKTREGNDDYLRQYTHPYRMVYPIKFQTVISAIARPLPKSEMDPAATDPDTHYLDLVVTPSVTFWNPYNVPVAMNTDPGSPAFQSIFLSVGTPSCGLNLYKNRGQLNTAAVHEKISTYGNYVMWLGGTQPIVFKPGESKIFSYKFTSSVVSAPADAQIAAIDGTYYQYESVLEAYSGLNTTKFIYKKNIAPPNRVPQLPSGLVDIDPGTGSPRTSTPVGGSTFTKKFTFKSTDVISGNLFNDASNAGGAASFRMVPGARQNNSSSAPTAWHYIVNECGVKSFGKYGKRDASLFTKYILPADAVPAYYNTKYLQAEILPRNASDLINSMGNPNDISDDVPMPLVYYGMMAGTETNSASNTASFPGGRKFAARPFLHSSVMKPSFMTDSTPQYNYLYGWNSWVQPLNDLNDIPIQVTADNADFYGGGYTAEKGSKNVVQRFLPLVPPVSLAEFSNAQLGGYSLAGEAAIRGWAEIRGTDGSAKSKNLQRVTVHGFGGPPSKSIQSIGNSYAHPLLAMDKAFRKDWRTEYHQEYADSNGSSYNSLIVDYSYLANKALWDDYFLSSISPMAANNPLDNKGARTAKQTAESFFFDHKPLPNHRVKAPLCDMTQSKLDQMFGEYDKPFDGFADKIGDYLMIDGGFNVNSTSVESWKTLFSSLRNKGVVYLDKVAPAMALKQDKSAGVPVAGGAVTNGGAYSGSSTNAGDAAQWSGWRMLTDTEIDELSVAMVKQVKERGPFLSLSEFINRRLDRSDPQKSVKGALQAAIDDPNCSINKGFRAPERMFSSAEKSGMNAVFPEAMEGAIAYGSNAYVDQADILKGIAPQLTVRGDTFTIRTYGDSLDPSGKVLARAWCEAVVQRVPEYVEQTEPPHTKQANLTKPTNKSFGRHFVIVGLRWLKASEI